MFGLANIPYHYRLLGLLLLMAGVALWEYRRDRAHARKWKEYGFLMICGGLGAVFGIANDQVTSTISPYYFYVFKGIEYGDRFRLEVAALGAQAGFFAGFLAGAIFLIANNPGQKKRSLSYPSLLSIARYPFIWAIALAVLTGAIFYSYQPSPMLDPLKPFLIAAEVPRFMLTWGIHIGLYLGAAVGTVHAVVKIRQGRKAIAMPDKID